MTKELERKIVAVARDGKLACAKAFEIAKEADVSVRKVGELTDKLKVKICACQLGCFR